jgi:hypothetical protein
VLKRVILGAERTTPVGTFCDDSAVIRSNLYDRNFGSGYDVKESANIERFSATGLDNGLLLVATCRRSDDESRC